MTNVIYPSLTPATFITNLINIYIALFQLVITVKFLGQK